MQPDVPYSPHPFSVPCTMCSCFMFVFGGFFMIPGFIFAVGKEPDRYMGIFCIGIASIILMFATCCCCFVRKERKKEMEYRMNHSSMAQRLDGIELRLAQQSNTPVQILTPPETRTLSPPQERTQPLSFESASNYNNWTVIQSDQSYLQPSTSLGPDFDPSSRYRYPRNLSEERYSGRKQSDGYTSFEPSCPPKSSTRKTSQPRHHQLNISPSAPTACATNNGEEEPPPSYYDAINTQSYM